MAEIKSTLELVLERTRHLTLTEEEKHEQAVAEFKKSLRGLIQKCQDGAMTPDRFREDLQLLQTTWQVTDRGIVLDEISGRMDLDRDCVWAVNLLVEAFGIDAQGIRAISDEYWKAVDRAGQERIDEIRKDLGEVQGIHGTAVVPNLAADQGWAVVQRRVHKLYKPIWSEELDRLKQSVLS